MRVNFGLCHTEEFCLISLINAHKHIKDKAFTSWIVGAEMKSLYFHSLITRLHNPPVHDCVCTHTYGS